MNKYCFAGSELNRIMVAGAAALGIINKDLAKSLLTQDGLKVNLEKVENGFVLEVGQVEVAKPKKVKTGTATSDSTKTGGMAAEKVKEALAKVMDSPPGLNTINTWTPTQKKEAVGWASHPTVSSANRPEFIVPRKKREAKASTETVVTTEPAEKTEPKATNGASETKKFFSETAPKNEFEDAHA